MFSDGRIASDCFEIFDSQGIWYLTFAHERSIVFVGHIFRLERNGGQMTGRVSLIESNEIWNLDWGWNWN